jgi:TRAP-type mannitol/chloroaromatic compound transport system substrate-binding protein
MQHLTKELINRENAMKTIVKLLGAVAVLATGATAAHAEKWDMPMAYPASNFHSENGAAFAKCVTDATSGGIEIVTHPGGSLFSGNDIKRAVQTGQAPIGERLLSAHANENILFGYDSVPFLATSFDDSAKLLKAAKETVAAALDEQNLVYVYSVPWPPQGFYFKKEVNSGCRHGRHQVPRLQCRDRADCRARRHGAGADRSSRTEPGAGHRCCGSVHFLGLYRCGLEGLGKPDAFL